MASVDGWRRSASSCPRPVNNVHGRPEPSELRGAHLLTDRTLLLTAQGSVSVSDFGLAKPMQDQIFTTSAVGVSGYRLSRCAVHRALVPADR